MPTASPQTPILSYASKFASAFYGPFREAADSAPQFGDRRSYQMDGANLREAMREIELDLDEGADMILMKPAMPYLDVVRAARDRFDVPIGAYQVSGEYSMLQAAFEKGWLERDRAILESLIGIRRAGADFIVTYFAKDAAKLLALRSQADNSIRLHRAILSRYHEDLVAWDRLHDCAPDPQHPLRHRRHLRPGQPALARLPAHHRHHAAHRPCLHRPHARRRRSSRHSSVGCKSRCSKSTSKTSSSTACCPLLLFAGAFLLDIEELAREKLAVAILSILGTGLSFILVALLMELLSGRPASLDRVPPLRRAHRAH